MITSFLITNIRPLDIEVQVQSLSEMNFSGKDISGFLFQYPDTEGSIENLESIINEAKKNGVRFSFVLFQTCVLIENNNNEFYEFRQ